MVDAEKYADLKPRYAELYNEWQHERDDRKAAEREMDKARLTLGAKLNEP